MQLNAEQRPRSGTDVRESSATLGRSTGHACDSGAGVMRRRRDHLHSGMEPGAGAQTGKHSPDLRAGLHDLGQHRCGQTELLQQIHRPRLLRRMKKLRRRCVREFSDARATHFEMQVVRDHQEAIRRRQHRRVEFVRSEKLVERIDLHELRPARRENLLVRHARLHLLQHAMRACVAIIPRLFDQLARLVDQHVIDAPSIRADRHNRIAEPLRRQRKPALDLAPDSRDVPALRVADRCDAGGETVEFFEAHLRAVPNSGHHAAALRAAVHCKVDFFVHGMDSV